MKSIYIAGLPIAKLRPRKAPWGNIYDPNKQTQEASLQKARLTGDRETYDGPLFIVFDFVFPRPKSHYGSGKNANTLKASAPEHCNSVAKDIDNLAKFYCDAFNCIHYLDDRQVVKLEAIKRWAKTGEIPHVQMDIFKIVGSTLL
jgi:Holliday junction resolvase RusA-like endonuclease